jgi:hypothetical protein
MKKLILLFILSILLTELLFAQKNSVELFTKKSALSTQMMLNKKFSDSSKFGFFSIINFTMPYNREEINSKKYSIQANVSYSLSKHILLLAGSFITTKDYGASLGVATLFGFKNGSFVLVNRHSLLATYSSEFLMMTEYKPKLTKKISLYSRLQTLTETNFTSIKKNAQMLRVGFDYKQFQFGIGATLNVFKNENINKDNIGFFLRTTF